MGRQRRGPDREARFSKKTMEEVGLLLADLVVVTMAETSLADSGAVASLERAVRGLVSGGHTSKKLPRFLHTVFRPHPLAPISGRRVFYVTTAGDVHLPVGYETPDPIPAVDYLATHPQE